MLGWTLMQDKAQISVSLCLATTLKATHKRKSYVGTTESTPKTSSHQESSPCEGREEPRNF